MTLEEYIKKPQVVTHILLLLLQKANAASDGPALASFIAWVTGYNSETVCECISTGAIIAPFRRDESYTVEIESLNNMLKDLNADIRASEYDDLSIVESLYQKKITALPVPNERTMICVTHVLRVLFEKADISFVSGKKKKIAHFMSLLTGYKEERIRQRFSVKEGTDLWFDRNISEYHRKEFAKVDKLLKLLNIEISFQIQKPYPVLSRNNRVTGYNRR
jgi:hypothetical protein